MLGVGEQPAQRAPYAQILFVQREPEDAWGIAQGLTLALIARLAGFATWKGLGGRLHAQLEPETVLTAPGIGRNVPEHRQTRSSTARGRRRFR